jgi:hypothetical protein
MIRFNTHIPPPPERLDADQLRRTIEKALPHARQRAIIAGRIRAALEADDTAAALRLAREYVGLPPAE